MEWHETEWNVMQFIAMSCHVMSGHVCMYVIQCKTFDQSAPDVRHQSVFGFFLRRDAGRESHPKLGNSALETLFVWVLLLA